MSQPVTATVRMYRLHELGDCFLLTFTAGTSTSRMLIDCGSFRNGTASVARLETIVEGLRDDLDGAGLDVVVGTHQHNDHLSGFVHCKELFQTIGVEQVWLSWLDDPDDTLARSSSTAHKNLLKGLADARDVAVISPAEVGVPFRAPARSVSASRSQPWWSACHVTSLPLSPARPLPWRRSPSHKAATAPARIDGRGMAAAARYI